jgi:Protein of unknown function (DUF2752)
MQLCLRRLDPGESDHELIWLSVSLTALGMAAGWFALGLPWPRCAFHALTGLPCITCGMTRAAIQFFHGHFLAAFQWNPLVFAALCGLSIFNGYAFIVLTTRAPRLRIALGTRAEKKYARVIVITALALNWTYLLSHWRDFQESRSDGFPAVRLKSTAAQPVSP